MLGILQHMAKLSTICEKEAHEKSPMSNLALCLGKKNVQGSPEKTEFGVNEIKFMEILHTLGFPQTSHKVKSTEMQIS